MAFDWFLDGHERRAAVKQFPKQLFMVLLIILGIQKQLLEPNDIILQSNSKVYSYTPLTIFNISGLENSESSCTTITVTQDGIRFNDNSGISAQLSPVKHPRRVRTNTACDFNTQPPLDCYLGNICGAKSIDGTTTTWVHSNIGNMISANARAKLVTTLKFDVHSKAENIFLWSFVAQKYETMPSNALTVIPPMPSNAVTVAPSVIPASSMGGAPVQIMSALSDGTLEINIQGWIARTKREDIMKQIQSHSVRNCPNNHCTSYHQKSQDCDCTCQVKSLSTCIQCPKFAEGVMAKFEFAVKDAQRALYCGVIHTEASDKSMMRGLRCITSSSTAPATASPSNTTNRPPPLTFDQLIEVLQAQGMASRLDDSTVDRIRNLH